ncbi:hypothetical protein [Rhodococcus sp. 66b]|uniref:hypothetical protein n=1 Tax=Rhodococcus sp. 66b TaxID=1945511 RepID=UPI0009BBD5CB|nr:hypothetical protein [Rhodococcus sp. 66b]
MDTIFDVRSAHGFSTARRETRCGDQNSDLTASSATPMISLLRTTLLGHAQHGSDIAEPTLLGLLAIAGVLEERLTRLEATLQPATPRNHPMPHPPSSPSSGGHPDIFQACRKAE